jgi:hypothetical protein
MIFSPSLLSAVSPEKDGLFLFTPAICTKNVQWEAFLKENFKIFFEGRSSGRFSVTACPGKPAGLVPQVMS